MTFSLAERVEQFFENAHGIRRGADPLLRTRALRAVLVTATSEPHKPLRATAGRLLVKMGFGDLVGDRRRPAPKGAPEGGLSA